MARITDGYTPGVGAQLTDGRRIVIPWGAGAIMAQTRTPEAMLNYEGYGPDFSGLGLGDIQGDPGIPGLTGMPGLQGTPGIAGLPGLPGLPGEMGAAGEVGPEGAMGPMGPPGPAGRDGEDGERGPRGYAGEDGTALKATTTEAAPADGNINVNITDGPQGQDLVCEIIGGTALNAAIPRLASGDIVWAQEKDGVWYCVSPIFQTIDTDHFQITSEKLQDKLDTCPLG